MVPGALLVRLLKTGLSFGLITSLHNGPRFRTLVMGVGDLIISVSDAVARQMRQSGVPDTNFVSFETARLAHPRFGGGFCCIAGPSRPAGPLAMLLIRQ